MMMLSWGLVYGASDFKTPDPEDRGSSTSARFARARKAASSHEAFASQLPIGNASCPELAELSEISIVSCVSGEIRCSDSR